MPLLNGVALHDVLKDAQVIKQTTFYW